MELWTDRERDLAGNEANFAFGAAYLTVHNVTQAAADKLKLPDEARRLLDEMVISQNQLLDLLRAGAFAAVCELALSIVVLAERIAMLVE
jgi:hypothetical protein